MALFTVSGSSDDLIEMWGDQRDRYEAGSDNDSPFGDDRQDLPCGTARAGRDLPGNEDETL